MALGAHPEASLRQRIGEAFGQKHAIARWAASGIVPGESILLDVGSTEGALVHELRGFDRLSVTTPGIKTMQELADSEGIEVNCLGSRLHSVSQSFVGPLAEAALEWMSFDLVFLSPTPAGRRDHNRRSRFELNELEGAPSARATRSRCPAQGPCGSIIFSQPMTAPRPRSS